MTPPQPGDEVLCWFPNFAAPPWRATVRRVELRVGDLAGFLVGLEPRPPCDCCGRAHYTPMWIGDEWIDPDYAAREAADALTREAQEDGEYDTPPGPRKA